MTQRSQDSANLHEAFGSHLGDQEPLASTTAGGSPVSRRTGRPANTKPRKRCAYCNEPFVPYRNRDEQKYCSRDCAAAVNFPRTGRVDVKLGVLAERDAPTARRAPARSLVVRSVRVENGRRYVAVDADALLEEISESDLARPGHVYG